MTVTVSFDTPQIQVSNSITGIQLSQVILPYSIRNSEDSTQYLGGQMTLGQADGIKLTDNTKDWERLGLAKIKNMVADAEIYVPDPIVEVPASSAADSATNSEATVASSSVEASASSAVEVPVSSADNSLASSEVTVEPSAPVSSSSVVASSVAPASSSSAVASSSSTQVVTAPSESTTTEA